MGSSDHASIIQVEVGPRQSLTFKTNPSTTVESHIDLGGT